MFSSPFEPQACKVLDNGYSLACSVHFSKEMYADGIKDGKIDTVYENNIRMHHIIQLLKKGKDFYLHNSW